MWSHILREQLEVTVDVFWACVQKGRLPDRGAPKTQAAGNALPLYLIRALGELGVDEASVLTLTPGEAANLLAQKLTEQQIQG